MTNMDTHRDDEYIYKILKLKRDRVTERELQYFINTTIFDHAAVRVSYKDFIRPFEERIQNLEAENETLQSLLTVKPATSKMEMDEEIEKKMKEFLEEPRALMLQTIEKTMKMMEVHGRLEAAHKVLEEKMKEMELQHKETEEKTMKMIKVLEVRTIMNMGRDSDEGESEDEDEVEDESDEEEDDNDLNESQQQGLDEPEDTPHEVEDGDQQASDEVEDEIERPPAPQPQSTTENARLNINWERSVPPTTAHPQPANLPSYTPAGPYPFGPSFAPPFAYRSSQNPFQRPLVPDSFVPSPALAAMMSASPTFYQLELERQRAIENQAQMREQQRRMMLQQQQQLQQAAMQQQHQAAMQPVMGPLPDSFLAYNNGVPSFVPLRNNGSFPN